MKIIHISLSTLLCLLTISAIGQDKKLIKASKGLPDNTLLSISQFRSNPSCEVCSVEETLPDKKKIYYQYDRVTQKKIQPEGTKDVSIDPVHSKRSMHAYQYPNGETLMIFTPTLKGVVKRPYKTLLLPKGFSGKKERPRSWSYYKDILAFAKKEGDKTYYKIYDEKSLKPVTSYSDWITDNNQYDRWSTFIRLMPNGFYQILKPDKTLIPKDTTDETIGFIPIKKSLLYIEVVKINGQEKYYLNQIDNVKKDIPKGKKKENYINKREIMRIRRLNDTPAKEYYVVSKTFGGKEWSQVILNIDSNYRVVGLPDCQLLSGYKKNCVMNENITWFEEIDINAALELIDAKHQKIEKANKEHWEFIEYRNALSAEQRRISEENKKKSDEYNKALEDYKNCLYAKHKKSNCKVGSWTNVLSEQEMIQIVNRRNQQIKDKKESDAMLQETFKKRNNTIHITDEMKKKGYRVVKWDGKNWK